MRKVIYFFTTLLFSTVIFASEGLGIVSDEDFLKVGVTPENIEKAKLMVNRVSTNYKMLVLEKKQLELEVNKYVLENPEANLEKIDILFDKISGNFFGGRVSKFPECVRRRPLFLVLQRLFLCIRVFLFRNFPVRESAHLARKCPHLRRTSSATALLLLGAIQALKGLACIYRLFPDSDKARPADFLS